MAVSVVWLGLDQLTKLAALRCFGHGRPPLNVLPGLLDLTLTFNRGAAFSLLDRHHSSRFLFMAIALLALGGMFVWRRALLALPGWERYGLALVAAGAAGNLVDRAVRGGQVVDFIHFYIRRIGFDWPVFNVADIGVTCGMTVYVLHTLWSDLHSGEPAATAAKREAEPAAPPEAPAETAPPPPIEDR